MTLRILGSFILPLALTTLSCTTEPPDCASMCKNGSSQREGPLRNGCACINGECDVCVTLCETDADCEEAYTATGCSRVSDDGKKICDY